MEGKLNHLEDILVTFFRRYPAQKVLRQSDTFYGISAEEYVDIAFNYTEVKGTGGYSKEDLRNQFYYYCKLIQFEREKNGYCLPVNDEGLLDPMECLFYYVRKMLTKQDNEIMCNNKKD